MSYTEEAIRAPRNYPDKYINDRRLPDKAIDVIDEAGALANMKDADEGVEKIVDLHNIEAVDAKIARIPEKSVSSSELGQAEGSGDKPQE